MLCELSDPKLEEFIRAEYRGDKRALKIINTVFIQPFMALAATGLGTWLFSEDSSWAETKTYSPILAGYPFVFMMFMGTCVILCNTRNERNENPYYHINGSICDKITWNFELTQSKIHCEPYGTIASGFTMAAWSTIVTPTAALLGNVILQHTHDTETVANIITTNAVGGAIVGAIPGTIAVLYSLYKKHSVHCCPEPGTYNYKLAYSPNNPLEQSLLGSSRQRLPSLGTPTPFRTTALFTPNGTAITPPSTRVSYQWGSNTPARDLTAAFNVVAARAKDRDRQREERSAANYQWLRLGS